MAIFRTDSRPRSWIFRAVSMPSMLGICQSSSTASKGSLRSAAVLRMDSACMPDDAVTAVNPMCPSISAITARASALSSTTSTLHPRRSGSGRRWLIFATAVSARTVNQNVDPSPGTLSTPTSPPISAASFLEMERPSPVPPYCRVVLLSACSKLLNSRAICSSVSPMPVSFTANRSVMAESPESRVSPAGPVVWATARPTSIPICPFSVNFTALVA